MNRFNAMNAYYAERWCYLHHLKPVAQFIQGWIYLVHNSYVPYTCEIGQGSIFAYKGMATVVHGSAKIGRNCIIGTNVLIGGGYKQKKNYIIPGYNDVRNKITVPVIGDRVQICSGAKILGDVVVGDDAIIGVNAVVISDVPAGAVVAGVPAKVLRIRNDISIER